MLLSTSEIKKMVEKKLLVTDFVDKEKQIQQCGIDLTVGKILKLGENGVIDFDNSKRKLPDYEEISPIENKWILEPDTYHAAMNETIVLPENTAGIILPRSSALACGIELQSALWDPGYKGRSFMHFSLKRKITLYKNARIGQMIFFKLNKSDSYSGTYHGEDLLEKGRRG